MKYVKKMHRRQFRTRLKLSHAEFSGPSWLVCLHSNSEDKRVTSIGFKFLNMTVEISFLLTLLIKKHFESRKE